MILTTFRYAMGPRVWPVFIVLWLASVPGCGGRNNTGKNPNTVATDRNDSEKSPFDFEEAQTERTSNAATSHQQMLTELEYIRRDTNDTIDWLGDATLRRKERELESLPANASLQQRFTLQVDVADNQLRLGREEPAIESLRKARALLEHADPDIARPLTVTVEFKLGVAHMRLAETENCCSRNTPDSCVMPFRGGGIHTNTRGATEAIKHFEYVLQESSNQSADWLRALWLLNVAHMTLDQYPDQVPKAWRLPESMFQSAEPFPAFTNVAQERNVDTFSLSGGVIADDFDLDGDLDLVVSTILTDETGQLRYFSNDGNGVFVDRSSEAGLSGLFGGLNLIHADYNNDGFFDIYVLRGGWFQLGGRHPNSLIANNGDGTFTDVSFLAGVDGNSPTQTASWADYDHDGDVDLYVGNEYAHRLGVSCQLFRNNSDGTFTDVADQAGVTNDQFAKSVIWGDYDHDGWADLFVSNFGQPNRLYRNRGDGTFEDLAPKLGLDMPRQSFPSWFWDVNNDGNLDLLVTSYAEDVAYEAAEQLGIEHDGVRSRLFMSDGHGGFVDRAQEYGVDAPVSPMGCNFGDLDNDGFLDFYLGTGEPDFRSLMPNRMYRNREGKRFVDVTMAGRFGHLQKGHGVVFADFDGDGDQDVFEQMGGAYLGDKFYDSLFDNPGFENHYLAVRLVGRTSDRFGLGARICVVTRDGEQETKVYRTVNSGGTFGANPLGQWFGLGKATRAARIEIFWPTTGVTQVIKDVAADQTIQVMEEANRVAIDSAPGPA